MGAGTDWKAWHDAYDDEDGPLRRRLAIVQGEIRAALARQPPGPIRVVSMCAGQARDLIGALAGHDRATDVRARLVELDPTNAQRARDGARAVGLVGIEVVEGDASATDSYVGAVPAALLLVCGVFGNISDGDVERTIVTLPSLCAPSATVIWTRHRRDPDLTPRIRTWFAAAGFDEVAFHGPGGFLFSVGVACLAAPPAPFAPGVQMFEFVGYDALK